MKLKSFGCSFIFGTDLADDGRDLPVPTASNLTWPAHLARHCGYDYECYARPGSGNLQIAEQVLNQLGKNQQGLYVISWTWIDRFDYIDETSKWPGTQWGTLLPVDNSATAKNYYKNLHSEYRDKLTSLMSIKLVIDSLKQRNFPFIMTYMDPLMFDSAWHSSPAITDLQSYIRPFMTEFEGTNFLEWSRQQKFPIGPTEHPLEEAHAAAAKYMLELGVHKV